MPFKILLIDDDTNLLESCKRSLRSEFTVYTATSGQQGLDLLRQQGPFAVLVSDLKMAQMDGIEVLRRARTISPQTVRVLLTGHTDQEVAIKATNTGKVFRFLPKPCDTQTLLSTLQEATLQYRMTTAEQDLKEETLVGVVGLLSQILGQVNPAAQMTTNRIKRYCLHIARESGYQELWLVEMAAMLSQIGCICIPPAILHKQKDGAPLSEEEEAMIAAHPSVAIELLHFVPRFEEVATIIALAHGTPPAQEFLLETGETERIVQAGRILQTGITFNAHLMAGLSPQQAVEQLALDPKLDQTLIQPCTTLA